MTEPLETDPPLLRDNTEIKDYSAAGYTYPGVRIFYRPRDKIDELPSVPQPLPLLVFIHGLGGSAAQFAPLLTSLVPIASCLAVDLPGCGRSHYAETKWGAYTTESLCELLETIIEDYRDKDAGQQVVLIGHSLGTALCTHLASRDFSHKTDLIDNISGLVAICPVSSPPAKRQVGVFKLLLWLVPEWLFNLWRRWDRRGGPESKSVRRFVGEGADDESKRLQHIFNCQSRTPVWRRMAYGSFPTSWGENETPKGGIPTVEHWQRLDVPVFLVGGDADKVTPPSNVHRIANRPEQNTEGKAKSTTETDSTASSSRRPAPGKHHSNGTTPNNARMVRTPQRHGRSDDDEPESEPTTPKTPAPANGPADEDIPDQPLHPSGVIKTFMMPEPAGHALLYMPMTVRILAGNICDFLSTAITGRLAYSVCNLSLRQLESRIY